LPSLLARFAENGFWLARYMERAENLARILDVNESYAQSSSAAEDWLPIVQLHEDTGRFFAVHEEARADAVLHFYLLERDSPTSILSAVRIARENARALRHLISTEAWVQLNVFYNRLLHLTPADITLPQISKLCATIKEDCQLHTGIVEGTIYRDQAWHFYQIGKYLERADETSRLLDIGYHRLLPSETDINLPVDASQWNALLSSVAGYQAFRRVHPRGMQPRNVAAFLLFDRRFPRSVAASLAEMDGRFQALCALPELHDVGVEAQSLVPLRRIGEDDIERVLASGLHGYIDAIQRHLTAFAEELAAAFFRRVT